MLPDVSNGMAFTFNPVTFFNSKMKNILSHLLKRTGILTVILITIGLTGCSTIKSVTPTRLFNWEASRKCVDKVSIKGRFSIQYKLEGREESLHGKFTWEQKPELTVVTFQTPLGQTMAKIDIGPAMTTFTAPNRAPQSAPDAEELIKSQLGWTLPVSGMKGWLQGCATDSRGKPFIATPTATQVVTNDGWQINYASWIEGPNMPLPKRIDMVKGSNGIRNDIDISMKLVIDEWNF